MLEAMVVLVVLSIVGVGVGVGLQSATRVPEANDKVLALSAELTSEMENWKANAWTGSTWPSTLPYSKTDTVTIKCGGQSLTYNRTVTIKNWDPNNITSNSSPQTDFCQVQITINGQTVAFYLTRPS